MTQTLALANAIDQFITGCKADGTWGAIKSSCVLVGWNNLNGALVPLVGTAPTNFNFWGDADPSWASVSLLLRMNGANASTTFTDSSNNAFTVSTFGNAQISTAQSKFGGASGLFDGSGDYLTFTGSTLTDFGSGDFTIEMWARFSGTTDANGDALICIGDTATNRPVGIYRTSTVIQGWISTGDVNYQAAQSATSILPNVWHHIALTRSSNTLRVFVDGVQGAAIAVSGSVPAYSGPVHIGRLPFNASADFPGNIDDLRITKGVARYTSNFTPPTQALPGATADYNRETGLAGDGSTKYLDSNRNNNADPQNSCHISVYASTFGATTATLKIPLGRQINGINEKAFFASTSINSGQLSVRCQSTNAIEAHTSSRTNGLIGASRAISSTIAIRNNNSTVTASQTSTAPSTPTLFVFASSNGIAPNDGGSAANFDDSRLAFYSIGESIDLALLDTRVTALVNAIAAAIP